MNALQEDCLWHHGIPRLFGLPKVGAGCPYLKAISISWQS